MEYIVTALGSFLLSYLTQTSISTILSSPRIFTGGGYPDSRYEDIVSGLVSKLPKLKKLRDSLPAAELRKVIDAERKAFDDLYRMRNGQVIKKQVDPTTGDFVPFTKEQVIPSTFQDVNVTYNTNGLAFSLPNSNWGGPSYSGGRFLENGEYITRQDLAVLPTDNIDLISRRHDIHYALIGTLPDEQQRDDLKKVANSIYTLSLWQNNDFPGEANEAGEIYYRTVQKIVPTLITLWQTGDLIERLYTENVTALTAARDAADMITIFRPVFEQMNSEIADPTHRRERLILDILRDAYGEFGGFLGPRNAPVASPYGYLQDIYLRHPDRADPLFQSTEFRQLFQLDQVDASLERIGSIALDNPNVPIPELNRMIDREIELLDARLRTNANLSPDLNSIISTESWVGLLKNPEFWLNMALIFAVNRTFNYLAERQLERRSQEDIAFRNLITGSNINYRQAHPLWNRLAEVTFRLDFGFGIPYQPLTNDQINMYIDALEPEIPDDPIVKAVREYQGINAAEPTPDKPSGNASLTSEIAGEPSNNLSYFDEVAPGMYEMASVASHNLFNVAPQMMQELFKLSIGFDDPDAYAYS